MDIAKLTPEEISLVDWSKVGPMMYGAMVAVMEDAEFSSLDVAAQGAVEDSWAEVMAVLKPE